MYNKSVRYILFSKLYLIYNVSDAGNLGASLGSQLQQTRENLEAAESSNKQLTKSRDLLVAQLKNSKEV